MEKEGWRSIIFYLTKKGLNAQETHQELLSEYSDDAPSYTTVARWAAEWKRGRRSIQDGQRTGRPADVTTDENIMRVMKLIENDGRVTIKQITKKMNIGYGTVQRIINCELHLSKVSARWVPKMLSSFDKMRRLEISKTHLEKMKHDPEEYLNRIVTQDEIWVHHFDPETKQQSLERRSKGSQTPRKKMRRSGKVMALIFWDSTGILMIDYLERGKTINGEYYAEQLARLRERIKEKRRGKLSRGVLLLQGNATAYKTPVAEKSVKDCGFEIMDHPPYSPDLAPSDYYLFPSLKQELSGQVFGSNDDIIDAVEDLFEEKDEEFFKKGISSLEKRWAKCVAVNGEYFDM